LFKSPWASSLNCSRTAATLSFTSACRLKL
jgi:hypothetical protein